MSRVVKAAGMLAVLFVATSASAEGASPDTNGTEGAEGVHLALRLGYAIPFGLLRAEDSASGLDEVKLNEVTAGQIPFWLDLGYWVAPQVMVGAYGQYGVVLLEDHPSGCPSGADCSAYDVRFGLQGQYHLLPGRDINPWMGLGIGYEILGGSGEQGGFTSTRTYRGMEYANLQAGATFALPGGVGVGPFLSLAFGEFSRAHFETFLGEADQEVEGLHEWLTLGVRLSYDPGRL